MIWRKTLSTAQAEHRESTGRAQADLKQHKSTAQVIYRKTLSTAQAEHRQSAGRAQAKHRQI